MKQFLPVKVEILYLTNEDVITTSGVLTDDEADVVKAWSQGW